MKEKRFKVGITLTICWLAVMVAFVGFGLFGYGQLPGKVNEWGDFFAGFFAPLAFLWLVLGYLQQGEELRLQAAELKNSVEQQTQLVQETRRQIEQDAEANREERERQHRRAQPVFEYSVLSYADNDTTFEVQCRIANHGMAAREVMLMTEDAEGGDIDLGEFSALPRGAVNQFTVRLPRAHEIQISISYTDINNSLEVEEVWMGVIQDKPCFIPSVGAL
ncbi:hypothetical protein [Pelomonas sp. SE-A7]|uniref:hypothetical protein n=1 Tax=Pelomonas sp. SE-A7 TaxID=3054953 RepID=UPI00259CD9EA|nr:hypothetical protein [Pelomonas sp. SE-A7]MDM4766150.1 hypothetical protein [Pelomonas sp. SE-A7]